LGKENFGYLEKCSFWGDEWYAFLEIDLLKLKIGNIFSILNYIFTETTNNLFLTINSPKQISKKTTWNSYSEFRFL